MVSYQRHTSGLYRTVRDRIQSAEFGRLLGVQASINQNWRVGTAGKWRQVPELAGGGFLIDSGSHLLDAVLWCTGRQAARVSCISDFRGTPVDIISSINGEFEGGGLFTIFANGDDRKFYEDLTYYGEGETLRVTDGKLFALRAEGPREEVSVPASSTPDQNFADAILGRAEAESPFEAGLAVGLLTDACHRSAARNGEFETVG